MSTDRDDVPCRSLDDYVSELVERLGARDRAALARLRQAVGERSARIAVDEQSIDVRFDGGRLVIEASREERDVDGSGCCDRRTVLDLLDGYLEVNEAILSGRLRVFGRLEAVERIFVAIEILLDGSARVPELRALADDYRRDPCLATIASLFPNGRRRRGGRSGAHAAEMALLARLDLMP
jgi:hypothetical protein